jgi:hypothetical protein
MDHISDVRTAQTTLPGLPAFPLPAPDAGAPLRAPS